MADTVTTKVLNNGLRNYVAVFTNVSDGTGESAVVKVDKSGLTGPVEGVEPTGLVIEEVAWSISGGEVKISYDHTTDQTALVLSGTGVMSYREVGGLYLTSSGGTGDVLFTTNGFASGDTYNITLWLRKKA